MTLKQEFNSRRSDVRSRRGMVATSQPLAAQAGLRILMAGGNAADAAVATAAVLNVVEPISTGIGGDCFALFYDAATRQVTALNGSGRTSRHANPQELVAAGYATMPSFTGHAVSVPGTAAGWEDLLARHGTMTLADVLAPAIEYAADGYPVSEWIALGWQRQVSKLLRSPDWDTPDLSSGPPQPSGNELLIGGRAPQPGEIIRMPELAETLRGIAASGSEYIYHGDFADKLAAHVQRYGGWLDREDLAGHRSHWVVPLAFNYHGRRLHECPPNGQGLAALLALALAKPFQLAALAKADRVHVMIECMRLGFTDALRYVTDPESAVVSPEYMLTEEWLAPRRDRIRMDQAAQDVPHGLPPAGTDTVYLCAADEHGNGCSFINSLYQGTGTGLVVPGTGVSLQNRGAGFVLDPDHPNVLCGGRRPYHTIIPGMVTAESELLACMGVMGGYMQPQGHFQMMVRMYDEGLPPQRALDAPRWQLAGPSADQPNSVGAHRPGGRVLLEPGFEPEVMRSLQDRGHRIEVRQGLDRGGFGGGQIIARNPGTGVLTGGSDPRKDGCAIGW